MATITNQATLSYRGLTRLSNVTVGQVDSGLTVDKNVAQATYAPEQVKVYTVSVRNTGTAALDGLTLTDDLGAYDYQGQTLIPLSFVEGSLQCYVNGVYQSAPAVTFTDGLSLTLPEIPAEGEALLVYEAAANRFADPAEGGSITNTATVSGAPGGGASASVTLTALGRPELTVTKTMSPVAVTACQPLTYAITVENHGNTATSAQDEVTVTDTFSPPLHAVTVTLNGQALAAGTDYTYDETTGQFATAPGVIAVDAAAFVRGDDGSFTVTPAAAELAVTGTLSADCAGA